MPAVTRRPWAPAQLCLLSILLSACGGGSSTYRVSSGATAEREAYNDVPAGPAGGEMLMARQSVTVQSAGDEEDSYAESPPAPPPEPAARSAGGAGGFIFGSGSEERLMAQADVRHREPVATPPQQVPNPRQAPDDHQTTDATSGPLLIYQATLHLAVYQVQDNQRSVIAIAREMDGFLAQQSDTIVVVRVPARKFVEALGRIEALGDVLHRNIQATDVSEEFRDSQIRLRNMEQVRDRLAALLAQARTVEESLQIEHELERLTTEIESMKGRIRFLEDRIAFSTITVNFSPREQETLNGELFNLPFDFLYNLGLRTLLNLR